MRTAKQERARFGWMKPSEVAAVLGCGDELVREHIHAKAFPCVGDEPGVINIGTATRPQYRIHPESFRLFVQGAAA
jgi:hypothetical protein